MDEIVLYLVATLIWLIWRCSKKVQIYKYYGETQMDILTDTRYLVPKIYSIVIGHAGIPPKKIRHGYVKQLFSKKLV